MAPTPQARRDARTFGLGVSLGFVVGAFVVAAIVWQFGNVIGSRAASVQHPADPPAATARWGDGGRHTDVPVLEPGEPANGMSGGPVPPAASPEPRIGASDSSSEGELAGRALEIPVEGVSPSQLTRSFEDERSGNRVHQAIDILAPRNTPVRAVEDGTVARLFVSRAGGITIYQFDPSERYCYYYAHLERYADGVTEGGKVRKGQVIGYVGTSGNAPKDTPHLHFAVYRLTADKRWWEGTPLDPYDILR